LYTSEDIDLVLDMMSNRLRDFKETTNLKPFYLKGINTLRQLVKEDLNLDHLYYSYLHQYN